MNKSKKLVFSFFISASLMAADPLIYKNNVHASGFTPNIGSAAYTSTGNIFARCGYSGECTWFTYGRVIEKLGISLPSEFYGNAIDWWYANARDSIYSYGSEPRANSIAVWSGGSKGYGHVGFVEDVSGDIVYLNEGNFNIRGSYDGSVKKLTKSQMQDRGNLFLKGYIYLESPVPKQSQPNTVSTSTQVTSTSIKTGIVNVSTSLNVRNGANISSNIIGSLKNGQSVNIVGVSGNWYKIKYNSTYGYVSSNYIKTGNLLSSSTAKAINTSVSNTSKKGFVKLKNKFSALNLRNAPNGNIIGILSNGTAVDILGTSNGWYKVNVGGKIGYVFASYISTSTQTTSSTTVSPKSSSKYGIVTLKNPSSALNLRLSPWTGRVIASLANGTKVSIIGTSGLWYKVNVGGQVGYVHSSYINL
ncbi:SH3 domain-containing protein [Clostridium sp.]|jgi:uncharacterized protein YgiM (DUF1202 family)/surface antigen|uniref:SH3 domain-containing protein n=1 Tax=Clostridium sp. TaxID=1506 RepID=UPI003A5C6528